MSGKNVRKKISVKYISGYMAMEHGGYGGNSSRSRDNVHFKRTMNQNTYLLEDSNGESYCIEDTDTDFFDVMNVELQNLHDSSTFDNYDNSILMKFCVNLNLSMM